VRLSCTPAAPRPGRVLRLAGTLGPAQGASLAAAVLERAGRSCGIQDVVLDIRASAQIGAGDQRALCELRDTLAQQGVTLRLALSSPRAWQQLPGPPRLAVYPSLRAAVLAAYAEAPGPGLVTAGIRAQLTLPAEPVGEPAPARATPAVSPPPRAASLGLRRPGWRRRARPLAALGHHEPVMTNGWLRLLGGILPWWL
jgi:hypothetical protein